MKNIEDIYPLSSIQRTMLLHSVGNPTSTELNTQIVFELNADADLDRIFNAWNDIAIKHCALRTGFYWKGNKEPVQFVLSKVSVPCQILEIISDSADGRKQEIESIIATDANEPFDLSIAPMMRIKIINTGNKKNLMIWTSHHIVLDRWCISIIASDLIHYYQAEFKKSSANMKSFKTGQYKQYIDYIQNRPDDDSLNYWNQYLDGCNADATSSLVERNPSCDSQFIQHEQKLKQSVCINFQHQRTLSELTKRTGFSGALFAQLAWALTQSSLTHQTDVAHAITVSGRPSDLKYVENTVGCFINNIPSRTKVTSESSIKELLESLKQDQWNRERYQYVSITDIQNTTIAGHISGLRDILFVWLNAVEDSSSKNSELSLVMTDQDVASAFPVTISVAEHPEAVEVFVTCRSGYRTLVPVQNILKTYNKIIVKLSEVDVDTKISDLGFFPTKFRFDDSNKEGDTFTTFIQKNKNILVNRSSGRESSEPEMLRQVLSNEWKLVLGMKEMDFNRSFFELGGTSLDAVKLHARIERMLRSSLPLLPLFQTPYIDDMLEFIQNGNWSMQDKIAIPVKEAGSKEPLFFIASPDVNTIGCSQLANKMKSDRPVVVLQAPPDSKEFRSLSPSELPHYANRYIDAMKEMQNTGPYHLFGMCTGAQLTFEMAKQLETNDEVCNYVGILNTWSLFTVSQRYRLQQFLLRYEALKKEQFVDWPSIIWKRLIIKRGWNPIKSVIRQNIIFIPFHANQEERFNIAEFHNNLDEIDAREIALTENAPPMSEQPVDEWIDVYGWYSKFVRKPKLQQPINVIRIKTQPFWRIRSENLGWDLHAESVTTTDLACNDHHALLREPWVQEVASVIDSHLETACDKT